LQKTLRYCLWLRVGVGDIRQTGLHSLVKQRGFKIANIRGVNAIALAEQAMTSVLALAKKAFLGRQYMVEIISLMGGRVFTAFSGGAGRAPPHQQPWRQTPGHPALAPGLKPGKVDLVGAQKAPDILLMQIAQMGRYQRRRPARKAGRR
jgi:lactate dehydrogenase-like 2-hydroxyacid dehydrogenase